jgi:hypothetical protein
MYKVTTITFLQEDPVAIKKFQMASRNLWNDNAWRVRNYIVSTLANTPDSISAGKWVIENISDLSGVVKEFYGEEAATKFTEIMRSFVSAIATKLELVKSGESISTLLPEDYDVINSLATFLDTTNPEYWKKEIVSPVIQSIFELWINQMLARVASEWDMDLKYTDEIHEKILLLADVFSNGLIAQFPENFTMGAAYVL